MDKGLPIVIKDQPGSALIVYKEESNLIDVCSPEGATNLPAQGNALGRREYQDIMSAQRAKSSPQGTIGPLGREEITHPIVPQGVALGWENFRAFGPRTLLHR